MLQVLAAQKRIPKEFLGAFKCGHRMASKDFIDEDFSRELLKRTMRGDEEAKKALEFLTKFNNEYHKNVLVKEDPDTQLHRGELRRERYRAENARNGDVYTKASLYHYGSPVELAALTETVLSGNGIDLILRNGKKPLKGHGVF